MMAFQVAFFEAGSIQLGCGKEKRKKKELKGDKCILKIPVSGGPKRQ